MNNAIIALSRAIHNIKYNNLPIGPLVVFILSSILPEPTWFARLVTGLSTTGSGSGSGGGLTQQYPISSPSELMKLSSGTVPTSTGSREHSVITQNSLKIIQPSIFQVAPTCELQKNKNQKSKNQKNFFIKNC